MELKEVVAVCDNEARVYGERNEKTGIRPLKRVHLFTTRGQALSFAIDREDRQREKLVKNGK
jgi:hypothetical protein